MHTHDYIDRCETGARIERGRVLEVSEDGMIVESAERPGVITLPLTMLLTPRAPETSGTDTAGTDESSAEAGENEENSAQDEANITDDDEIRAGDSVYFFVFSDGTGAVLGKIS